MNSTAPAPRRKARIEIIPLIDIMFFLLASFMLVSLTMIRLQGLHMSLPSKTPAPPPDPNKPPDEVLKLDVSASPAAEGKTAPSIFTLDKQVMTPEALIEAIRKRMAADAKEAKETKLFITVDKAAKHANLIEALDKVKQAGLTKFGFSLKPSGGAAPTVPGAPAPATAPAAPPPTS